MQQDGDVLDVTANGDVNWLFVDTELTGGWGGGDRDRSYFFCNLYSIQRLLQIKSLAMMGKAHMQVHTCSCWSGQARTCGSFCGT